MSTFQNPDAAADTSSAPSGAPLSGSASVVHNAARGGPPFVAPLPASRALLLSGSDARSFLHGQLANDVNGIELGGAGRSLLLNHKGHAMAEAAVLRVADGLLCIVDDDKLDWVAATLERHIVFDDVKLARPAVAVLTLQGSKAAAVLAKAGLTAPETVEGDSRVHVYASRRSTAGGFDLALSGGDAAELQARLVRARAVSVSENDLAAARIAALIPTAAREGGAGVLPQEAGLEPLISYRKGCYLGQEIMARIEARGNPRRELALLQLSEAPTPAVARSSPEAEPQRQAPAGQQSSAADQRTIFADGKKVGLLGTVAKMPDGTTRALAVLRREVEPTTELSVAGVKANRLEVSAPIMPL